MATRLTFKSESSYKDLTETDNSEDITIIESYQEREFDNLKWRFEQFVRFLIGDGFSEKTIQEYLNYDSVEVWKIEEDYVRRED